MAIDTGYRYVDKGWNRIKGEYKLLDGCVSLIGLFSESLAEDGQFVANYMAVHEFGSRDGIIPERSWIRSWVDKNKGKLKAFVDDLYKKIVDGKMNTKIAMNKIGEYVSAGLKESITNLRTPPLKLATIKRKKSSNPLIDTGRARNSITHKEYFGNEGKRQLRRAR